MKKVFLFGLALSAVLVLTGCGGPKGAVKDWKKAIKKGDKAAANKVSVSDMEKVNEHYIKQVSDGKDEVKYFDTLTPVEVVKVKTKDGKEETYVVCTMRVERTAKLKKVNDKWVVEKL